MEVQRIVAEPIHALGAARSAAWAKAKGADEMSALSAMYELLVSEAQLTWDIADHKGPVPVSVSGMLRLPLNLGLAIYLGWLETITPKATAVDELIPPSPLRDQLNSKLREKRKAA